MGRAHRRSCELGHHLGDRKTIVLANVIEESHGMVLDHHIVRGESLLHFIDPPLHYISTPLPTQMLREEGEGGREGENGRKDGWRGGRREGWMEGGELKIGDAS